MKEVFFYLFGVLSVFFAIVSVTNKNIVRGGVALLASFVSLGAVYFTLGAEFIGIVQIIVYGGAIIVLYLFALMTMDIKSFKREVFKPFYLSVGGFVSLIIFVVIFLSSTEFPFLELKGRVTGAYEISHPLFFKFLLPFEVVSVLLLVATIGAVAVGRRE